jgi:hypothetical protein
LAAVPIERYGDWLCCRFGRELHPPKSSACHKHFIADQETHPALCRFTAQGDFMPSSSFRTTSDGTPRIVDVTGATVTVDKYAMAMARLSTRAGRFLFGRGKLVKAEPRLGLFFRPRGLRFPTPRFRAGLRQPRVALAIALFTGSQLQPTEMFPQGVAHQSGTVSPSALRGLVVGEASRARKSGPTPSLFPRQ